MTGALCFAVSTSSGQQAPARFGVGGQVGNPAGITMRYYVRTARIDSAFAAPVPDRSDAASDDSRTDASGIDSPQGPSGATSGMAVRPSNVAYVLDALAAWDLDDFFSINLHLLRERTLTRSDFNLFWGPGLVMGVQDLRTTTRFAMGVSVSAGTNFFVERFEVFLQVSPHLKLLPDISGVFGGGIGLRYYFG